MLRNCGFFAFITIDYQKIISSIEKGESKLKKLDDTQLLLTRKLQGQNFDRFKIPFYHQLKGKQFTEDEDKFMLICLERIGYAREDVYDQIKEEIRKCPLFRFDWFIRTRNSQEIARRCHSLIALMERECRDQNEDKLRKKTSTEDVIRHINFSFTAG